MSGEHIIKTHLISSRTHGKRNVPFTLFRIIGIIIFILIITHYHPEKILQNIRNTHGDWLLYGVLLQLNVLLLKGFRWHFLKSSSHHGADIIRSIGQCLESYAVGVVTPGRIGEFLKIGHTSSEGTPSVASGIMVLYERGQDISLFILMAALSISTHSIEAIPGRWSYLLFFVSFLGIVISIFLLTSKSLSVFLKQIFQKLLRRSLSFSSLNISSTRMLGIILLSVYATLSYFLSCHCLAKGVGLHVSFLMTAGAVSFAGLLTLIPITIMGLGTREITFLYIFKAYPEPVVLAFSSLVFLTAQVGGAIIAFIIGQICLLFPKRNIT